MIKRNEIYGGGMIFYENEEVGRTSTIYAM